MPKLTALKVKTLTAPGRYGDGAGLYLRITPPSAKSWIQRIVINKQRTDLGLGSYPAISLAHARQLAAQNRTAVAAGQDPRRAGKAARLPTFADAAKQYHNAYADNWETTRHAKDWWSKVATYAFPSIGHIPVNLLDQTDVLAILEPIWTTKAQTARKVRQHLSAVFKWAIAHRWIDINPAGDAIDAALPRPRRHTTHQRAVPYHAVADALATVEQSNAYPTTKLCFRFLVLTAARSGEARGATWSEIDFKNKEWRIPEERMKSPNPHRVPLSQPAIDVLKRAHEIRGTTDLVFPSSRDQLISDSTISKLLRENSIPAVPHGFRSSFNDWASETTKASWAAVQLSLAHSVGNEVEKAYARSDLFAQRRSLMRGWAKYVTPSA